jgi:hypothetical protein
MILAFYRSAAGNWLDRAIDRMSGGNGFSHVEAFFPSRASCFSSSNRDASIDPRTGRRKANGTRWKSIEFDVAKWAFADLRTSPEQDAAAIAAADAILHARYDYAAIVAFVCPFWREHPDEFICSESVVHIGQAAFEFNGLTPWKESPNSLARRMGVT